MSGDPLIVFDRATIERTGGPAVLRDLSWTLRDGETWAVVGTMGSGKSTFLEAIRGKHRIAEGSAAWPWLETLRRSGRAIVFPAEIMRSVSFKEESRLFSYSGHYYQQRFEFADAEEPLSLEGFLRAGSNATDDEVGEIAERLGLAKLRELSFIKLSNGQARRARIARALLAQPELLLLDDPYVGLDIAGRAELDAFLGELVRAGQRLIIAAGEDAVPQWVTNVLNLGTLDPSRKLMSYPLTRWGEGRIERSEKRGEGLEKQSNPLSPSRNGTTLSPAGEGVENQSSLTLPAPKDSEPIIELRNVSVTHGGKPILSNVSWTVHRGERWALTGPNGAGKTTLLSLICGDHPQAYANDVRLFDRRRGTGESIWEVKSKIGLVSPELHLYFPGSLTAFEVAVTGFYDVMTFRRATEEQTSAVNELFAALGIAELAEKRFRRLSTGQQRLILLARAAVKRPPLLVLDEPFQGFDAATVQRMRAWLDAEVSLDQTMIFVSHRPEELPGTITHQLSLADGRVNGGYTF